MNKFFQNTTFSEPSNINLKQYRQNYLTEVGAQKINNQFGKTTGDSFNQNSKLHNRKSNIFSVIAPFLERVSCVAGDYIHQPNDQIDYIYFPETAVISEFEILKDGRAVGLSLHGNKSVLGLSSIFDLHPADNWTQVLLAGSAYKIKSEIFKNLLLQHSALQISAYEHVNSHIKQLGKRVVCNSYHTIEERLCSLLLTLHDCRVSNTFFITQEQIAHFLGTHRPSITQVALALRTRKIIGYVRKSLIILDHDKLKEAACDCYLR